MSKRTRRHQPLYPVLVAALALGGVAASSCGGGFPDDIATQTQKILVQQADAGTQSQQPDPNNFIGGGAPYEAFDAGPGPGR